MATNQTRPTPADQRMVSDAKRIVDKHLSDPNHVITEEEMRSIRVGATALPDGPTQQAVADAEDRIADHKADDESDTTPGAQKMTPWDVVQ